VCRSCRTLRSLADLDCISPLVACAPVDICASCAPSSRGRLSGGSSVLQLQPPLIDLAMSVPRLDGVLHSLAAIERNPQHTSGRTVRRMASVVVWPVDVGWSGSCEWVRCDILRPLSPRALLFLSPECVLRVVRPASDLPGDCRLRLYLDHGWWPWRRRWGELGWDAIRAL